MTPGMRTKSTRARKSKLPMIGEPVRIRTERSLLCSTRACAIARQRREMAEARTDRGCKSTPASLLRVPPRRSTIMRPICCDIVNSPRNYATGQKLEIVEFGSRFVTKCSAFAPPARLPSLRTCSILRASRRSGIRARPETGIVMDSNLFKYILKHSWREQLFILALVLVSQVPLFLVARPAQDDRQQPDPGQRISIRADATARYLRIRFELPDFLTSIDPALVRSAPARYRSQVADALKTEDHPSSTASRWTGSLSDRPQPDLLRARAHKWRVQASDQHAEGSRWASACCARLRYELFDQVLRFPLVAFPQGEAGGNRHHDQDEVEPLGGFIGDAFSPAGLPRRPGADGARLHPDAERLSRLLVDRRRSSC